jgi:predicted 2-oxoglutarate/Fe(II)-dependent dioxygenase YbiX
MYDSSLGDYISIYKNYFDVGFCESIVRDISGEPWEKHAYYNNLLKEYRTYSNDLSTNYSNVKGKSFIDEEMNKIFKRYINQDMSHMTWFNNIDGCSEIRFNRYDPSTEMRTHCDHIKLLFDGNNKGIPILSAVGLLNEKFVGGIFTICGKIIDLSVGDVIIFPSNFLYPHSVSPVKSGIRYSFVSWAW